LFKRLASLILLVFLCSYVSKSQSITPSYSNVDYVGKGNSKQMLDIYIPNGTNTPTPTIVHIHGGAFISGSKSTTDQSSFQYFYNKGWICVDINYRLSSDSIWPAQVYDCKAAIRFLKANANKYFIDTNKIGVIGESAGGYLVAMLGTTADVELLEGKHLGNSDVSSRIKAVVDLFGPINFLTMDAEASALGFTINTNAASSPESKLMGAAVQTVPELVARANPTTYITSDDASFFISAGSADKNIPYTQGQNFNNALEKIIGIERTSFELINGAGHGGSLWHSTEQDTKYFEFYKKAFNIPTSIELISSIKSNIIISPNPASDYIEINLDKVILSEAKNPVKIYNSFGECVMTVGVHCNEPLQRIDISHLPAGLYFIHIGNYSEKFMVVR